MIQQQRRRKKVKLIKSEYKLIDIFFFICEIPEKKVTWEQATKKKKMLRIAAVVVLGMNERLLCPSFMHKYLDHKAFVAAKTVFWSYFDDNSIISWL